MVVVVGRRSSPSRGRDISCSSYPGSMRACASFFFSPFFLSLFPFFAAALLCFSTRAAACYNDHGGVSRLTPMHACMLLQKRERGYISRTSEQPPDGGDDARARVREPPHPTPPRGSPFLCPTYQRPFLRPRPIKSSAARSRDPRKAACCMLK